MHLSLRLAFARTDCTPHDTLCTYGAKQLKLLGFSQRHLFLVQLDGGPEETRTLDLSDANRTLSRTVHNYAPKQGIFIVKISKITGNQCVCPFSYKTLFPLPVSVRECLLYFQRLMKDFHSCE